MLFFIPKSMHKTFDCVDSNPATQGFADFSLSKKIYFCPMKTIM